MIDRHNSEEVKRLVWYRSEQIGLKGEALSLHTVSGSSSVEWVEGSLLATKQPLTWYKVKAVSIFNSTFRLFLWKSNILI